ncbi:TM2 domain-containing membrane protein YozV [Flavobacterium sp. CG_9.10]|uniref:NINE protein n=1 Tax=Flavobacterium sp. CG_9.10 TaxID=2787729 RepID=UPI001A2F9071|nr:NINE protein [Flavobacterium sp. CG_9.10]MBG6111808.1 TM2 domain-containing membrane protein YozV [Flavobacterium sp. CG_9.10]
MGRFGISEIFILIIILAGIAYFVSKNSSSNMSSSTKSSSVAYLLWFLSFFGVLGFHRFYLGKIGTGLLWLFTGGIFGFGAFIDLFTLGNQVAQYNTNEELKTLRSATLSNAQQINKSKSITENVSNSPYIETENKTLNIEPHQEKIENLQNLKSLLDDGILTQEEFEKQKRKILG